MPAFVAIDGEEIGQGDDARYALLCSSSAPPIWSLEGLRTKKVLDYILDLSAPQTELVAFGLNYDVNQWLVDVPDNYLRELWETGRLVWKGYKLQWVPQRFLEIQHPASKRWAKVQEVFGFHQAAFVEALASWGIPVPDHVTRGKADRGTFTPRDRRRLTHYCQTECTLLVELMTSVDDAATRAGCQPWPHTWIGAGALAGTLLRNNDVAKHHRHDRDVTPAAALEPLMTAYHGGRIEVFRQGRRTAVSTYDIRSAYPSAMRSLPNLTHAKVTHKRRYQPDAEHAIWRASWSVADGEIMPLPVRSEGAVWWPRNGSGWYHACELRTAIAAGYPITVGEGYVLTPGAGTPFGFVDDLFARRRRFADQGDPAAKILKLGMNSIYGKLAQGHTGSYGKPDDLPRWQSYWWAGELTARVRARILQALLAATRPLFVATDGIFAADAPIPPSLKLGGWNVDHVDWCFVVQPGVYEAYRDDQRVIRAAGFFSKDVRYEAIRELWERDGVDGVYRYTSNRFIGLGTAIQRDRPDDWRRWLDEHRNIFLRPRRKDSVHTPDGDTVSYPRMTAPGPSEPYKRKVRLVDPAGDPEKEQAMDQPLRTAI